MGSDRVLIPEAGSADVTKANVTLFYSLMNGEEKVTSDENYYYHIVRFEHFHSEKSFFSQFYDSGILRGQISTHLRETFHHLMQKHFPVQVASEKFDI